MKFLNGWIDIPDEDLEKDTDKEQLTTAYNIAIKYGFCSDCRWVHDSDECHKYDCYVNAVSVIQAAIRKAYRGNISD